MQLCKFVALLGAASIFMAVSAGGALADPAGVGSVGGDLLLTDFNSATSVYSVTRQAPDRSGQLLFAISGQTGKVFAGGGKIGVTTQQRLVVKGIDVLKSIVWDISNPGSPAVVARATFLEKKGTRQVGCGKQVELLGVSSKGEFVVRSALRERHAKRKNKCIADYLVKKRRATVAARDRITVTLTGATNTIVQRHALRTLEITQSPLANAPSAKAAGTRMVDWDNTSLSVRELTKNAKATPFKFARGIQPISVDIGESGNVVAAGTSADRKGFLVTGLRRVDLPNQFSGDSYICGERIVEIARSPVVIDGKITTELAVLEWDLQGGLLKTTSVGKDHFAAAFACDAVNAYVIRQTVPAKRAELISIKLG